MDDSGKYREFGAVRGGKNGKQRGSGRRPASGGGSARPKSSDANGDTRPRPTKGRAKGIKEASAEQSVTTQSTEGVDVLGMLKSMGIPVTVASSASNVDNEEPPVLAGRGGDIPPVSPAQIMGISPISSSSLPSQQQQRVSPTVGLFSDAGSVWSAPTGDRQLPESGFNNPWAHPPPPHQHQPHSQFQQQVPTPHLHQQQYVDLRFIPPPIPHLRTPSPMLVAPAGQLHMFPPHITAQPLFTPPPGLRSAFNAPSVPPQLQMMPQQPMFAHGTIPPQMPQRILNNGQVFQSIRPAIMPRNNVQNEDQNIEQRIEKSLNISAEAAIVESEDVDTSTPKSMVRERRKSLQPPNKTYPPIEFIRGPFTNQLRNIIATKLIPLPSEYQTFENSLSFLSAIVRKVFDKAIVKPFGSTASNLHLRGAADIDLCVLLDEPTDEQDPIYVAWKEREIDVTKEFDGSESVREEEWNQRELKRIAEVKSLQQSPEADEEDVKNDDDSLKQDQEELQEKKSNPLEVRPFKKKPMKAFTFGHFVLDQVKRALESESRVSELSLILNTRIPIVKFNDLETNLGIDIGYFNILGIHNTRLIATYNEIDPRFREMVLFVKHWSKQKTINDTYHGTLSSYAYVLMVIHYLQFACDPPVLPCLQTINSSEATMRHVKVEDRTYDVYFFDDLYNLRKYFEVGRNQQSLGELLYGFFYYWAHIFDFKKDVASIRNGGLLTKEEKEWVPLIEQAKKASEQKSEQDPDVEDKKPIATTTETADENNNNSADERKRLQRYWICIEDPFEIDHNLGRPVGRDSLYFIRGEFLNACNILSQPKTYPRWYMTTLSEGGNPFRRAPHVADLLLTESVFKTREEHKQRNKANMEASDKRKKDRQA